MAKDNQFWENVEKELNELLEQRELLSRKIHILQVGLRQHKEKTYKNPLAGTNTKCYKFFGKRYKDLTDEEKKLWAKMRKQSQRERENGIVIQ